MGTRPSNSSVRSEQEDTRYLLKASVLNLSSGGTLHRNPLKSKEVGPVREGSTPSMSIKQVGELVKNGTAQNTEL